MTTIGTFFLGLWSRIARAWRRFRPRKERKHLYRAQRIADEPDRPEAGVVYVMEDAGIAWAAAMACPGGCGQVLHMNLIPDSEPVWLLTEHPNGTVSLHPSVWRREGCGCHFVLRQGKIEWCA